MNELAATTKPAGTMATVASSREVADVQASMHVAKMFPRDQDAALASILQSCKRRGLAEVAQYQYAKGGKDIVGPSIRMAETMARAWGNMSFGVRELESKAGSSLVEAYAMDLETNTRSSKTFTVSHIRHTKTTSYAVTDSRDIYEMVANSGARRLRACILALIPGDIVDAALAQCDATLAGGTDPLDKRKEAMLTKFTEIGVTVEMIETRIQRKFEAITNPQIVMLGKVFNAIRDGLTTVAKEFGLGDESEGDGKRTEKL
jgi:hypothetical protein